MRYEADGCEYFVGVVLCKVLSQRPVDFEFWVFQFANRLEAACGVKAKRTMPVVARPNLWTGFALGVCFCTKRSRCFP